ncbi:uncharacterized protein LOC128960412 [Oppia nitens]|uniref:uncharacterized protein LOC128960412 n=1 Tax=Oppia nitens TaxID=1686743 RepID=UPI0023DA2524|nr:uncharacterized protein LOC128960412 [Oppia nitens]
MTNNYKDCHELKFLDNPNECDITFKIENKTIAANKWLLRLRSDVFNAMFSVEFTESTESVIDIKDIKYNTFKALLKYIYCNRIILENDCNCHQVMDLYICADIYHIKSLMETLEKMLIQMINFETIEEIYEFAKQYSVETMFAKLNSFLNNNLDYYMTKTISELKRLATLSDGYLMELLVEWKNNEILRLETILSQLAANCYQCKNRITFNANNRF